MLFKQPITTQPFIQWLKEDKENKHLLWFSLLVMIISFGWLKFIYPYPNFMPPDSYSYLNAAYNNDFINQWPIGYSKFLRLVSVISRSHLLLVVFQYLLLMTSVLYLLFSIRFLLSPGKWLFRSLLFISIINPLLPHIANFISSDCLFATLSLVWLTQLLWVIHQPNLRLLLFHAIILLLAFMVRFSATWYPIISIAVIIVSGISIRKKWLPVAFIVTPILIFIGCTQYEYHKKTGITQYAAFSGWQLAANALYAYAYAEPVDAGNVPYQFYELHAEVNHHLDSMRKMANGPDPEIGIFYMWDFKSPLVTYAKRQGQKERIKKPYFTQWAAMGPLYSQYGRWLMTRYPWLYIKQFAWPNLIRYYSPPTTFMGVYNFEEPTVQSFTVTWFNWKNNQLPNRLHDPEIHIMNVIPTLLAILNPLFIVSSLLFIFFAGLKQCSRITRRILSCILLVWLGNCLFSVVSAPTELRYQIFPIVFTIPFCMIFMYWIIQVSQSESKTSLA